MKEILGTGDVRIRSLPEDGTQFAAWSAFSRWITDGADLHRHTHTRFEFEFWDDDEGITHGRIWGSPIS
jgi:hypothetical protein